MVPVLLFLFVATCIGIELERQRRQRKRLEAETRTTLAILDETEPRWTAGLRMLPELFYHQGHTWLRRVRSDLAYVGVDDFAARLIGSDSRLSIPAVGTYVRQGEPAVEIHRGKNVATLLSPVSGKVVSTNRNLTGEPELLTRAPYTHGFLYQVETDARSNDSANLLHGSLAERWMESTRERVLRHLMVVSGTVIQDGAVLADDFASKLPEETWKSMVDEFLSNPSRNLA